MIESLYHQAIKELAQSNHGAGHLASADATYTLDNPLCGDRVTIELVFDGEQIVRVAQETKACLLCQAAASLLASTAVGASRTAAKDWADQLRTYLTGDEDLPDSMRAWEVFAPVRQYRSRHSCVLLPCQALARSC